MLSPSSPMQMNFPRRVTPEMRNVGRHSAISSGLSTKSVLPKRTSAMTRPGRDKRSPRTTVSTSGSSGMSSHNKNKTIANSLRLEAAKGENSCRTKTEIQVIDSFHGSRVTGHESRQRQSRSRDNPRHPQNLLIFFFRDLRNDQAHVLQKLDFTY